jgi:hypothetical protein
MKIYHWLCFDIDIFVSGIDIDKGGIAIRTDNNLRTGNDFFYPFMINAFTCLLLHLYVCHSYAFMCLLLSLYVCHSLGEMGSSSSVCASFKARKLQGHQLARVTFALQELENKQGCDDLCLLD